VCATRQSFRAADTKLDDALVGFIIGGLIGGLSAAVSGWVVGHFNVKAAETRADADAVLLERQHERADLEHRQGVYHSFLNALSRVTQTATMADVSSFRAFTHDPDPEGKITQQFLAEITGARDLLNGILLFSPTSVEKAARRFDTLFSVAERETQAEALIGALDMGGTNTMRDLLGRWEARATEDKWRSALEELERAMRAEVAP
jgi:hypothetical protein